MSLLCIYTNLMVAIFLMIQGGGYTKSKVLLYQFLKSLFLINNFTFVNVLVYRENFLFHIFIDDKYLHSF